MSKHFSYSLLQYTPAEASGEVLNIGVLLVFANLQRVELLLPDNLTRLKQAFPNVSDKLVREYLRSIATQADAFPTTPDHWHNAISESWVATHFLTPDASSIRFAPVQTAVCYASPEQIASDYRHIYLAVYDQEQKTTRLDDSAVARQFKHQLTSLDQRLPGRIQESFQLEVEGTHYEFDFAWKNGRTNLIKALSFDVVKADTIQRKAERYFGQLTLLQPAAIQRSLHFDLLLARPSQRDLFKVFDRAINILGQIPNTNLWEGDRIQQYSRQAAAYLLQD